MNRISETEQLLKMAKVVAERGTCERLRVGAVISQQGRIISSGYNGSPSRLPHCDHSDGLDRSCTSVVHAEANAIVFAARHGVKAEGATLTCTHNPCLGCANLIINAGISLVVYGEFYKDGKGVDKLREAGIGVNKFEPAVKPTHSMANILHEQDCPDPMHPRQPPYCTCIRRQMEVLRHHQRGDHVPDEF